MGYFITLEDIEDVERFNEEVSFQIKKHKRALKRQRNVMEREVHMKHQKRYVFDDVDEQYEAYLRYGSLSFSDATF